MRQVKSSKLSALVSFQIERYPTCPNEPCSTSSARSFSSSMYENDRREGLQVSVLVKMQARVKTVQELLGFLPFCTSLFGPQ